MKHLLHRVAGPAALFDVPFKTAAKSGPGVTFNKNFQIQQIAHRCMLQNQNAVDQNEGSWLSTLCFLLWQMSWKVIKRFRSIAPPAFNTAELIAHFVEINRIGMIEIWPAFTFGCITQAKKIIVLRQE